MRSPRNRRRQEVTRRQEVQRRSSGLLWLLLDVLDRLGLAGCEATEPLIQRRRASHVLDVPAKETDLLRRRRASTDRTDQLLPEVLLQEVTTSAPGRTLA